MADRPLGIEDLLQHEMYRDTRHPVPRLPEHWVWCRVHEQARKNTGRCMVPDYIGATRLIEAQNSCITVGPFGSERETNRLSRRSCGNPRCTVHPGSLGMEVE